jgi:hypothetical protein
MEWAIKRVWVVENVMKIGPDKSKAVKLRETLGEGFTKLFFGGPKNSGSEQLQIFRNNHMQ